MAARTTKLELQQALNALGAETEALRVEVSQLRETNRILREKLEAAPTVAPRTAYASRQATPEQLAYRAALAAAKELAMRTGRSVRVGA